MNLTFLSRRRRDANCRVSGGFTLIELLVVMAITSILLGLLFGPLVQGFNLTNRARVQVLTQDSARRVMEITERDLGNGVFIFDNYDRTIRFWVHDQAGNPYFVPLLFAFADLVPPARQNDRDDTNLDPTTGLTSNRGDIALPVSPGRVIYRYFIGLRDNRSIHDGTLDMDRPVKVYANFYDDHRRGVTLDQHNPALLYRAIFSPYLPSGAIDTRLINLKGGARSLRAALNDPNFFYDTDTASGAVLGWKDLNGDGVPQYFENWAAISRPMLPTERADEVTLTRNEKGDVIYDLDSVSTRYLPHVTPQIRFQPTYVGNDQGAPSSSSDIYNAAHQVPPSSYVATNGHWTQPYNLTLYRSRLSDAVLDYFYLVWDRDATTGELVYDILHRTYDTTSKTYSNPVNAHFHLNKRGQLEYSEYGANPPLIMFTVDNRRGVINTAFPDSIVMHDSAGKPQPARFYPGEPNYQFDQVAAVDVDGDGIPDNNAYRFISLAKLTPPAGFTAPGPALNPGVISPFQFSASDPLKTYIPAVQMTPGSEVVKGPDMQPGPHYGQEVVYTRVNKPLSDIGWNEYAINYTDAAGQADPTGANPFLRIGTIIFNSQMPQTTNLHGVDYVTNALPVHSFDPATGQLTGEAAPITVTYQMQNNTATDIVRTDYLTRQLMSFVLGVRLYDFNSGQPQQVTLTQKVKVRNLQR